MARTEALTMHVLDLIGLCFNKSIAVGKTPLCHTGPDVAAFKAEGQGGRVTVYFLHLRSLMLEHSSFFDSPIDCSCIRPRGSC